MAIRNLTGEDVVVDVLICFEISCAVRGDVSFR